MGLSPFEQANLEFLKRQSEQWHRSRDFPFPDFVHDMVLKGLLIAREYRETGLRKFSTSPEGFLKLQQSEKESIRPTIIVTIEGGVCTDVQFTGGAFYLTVIDKDNQEQV